MDVNQENALMEDSKSQELLQFAKKLNKQHHGKFSQEAFDSLAKSVKLDPKLSESWIELAECYQRKSDIAGAISCLENAMKNSEKPDKRVLRDLSACLRSQEIQDPKLKFKTLLDSLEFSKQALRLDMNDPVNYYNLGKAYMCLFFYTSSCDRKQLELSRMAFEKALILSSSPDTDPSDCIKFNESKADFLFNFSSVLLYEQNFQRTIECLEEATRIDPLWQEPKESLENVRDYLTRINIIMVSLQGPKLPRKYKKDLDTFVSNESRQVANIIQMVQDDQRRLNQSQAEEEILTFQIVTLKDLIVSQSIEDEVTNQTKPKDRRTVQIMNLKPLEMIDSCNTMYLTLIGVDQHLDSCVLIMYNVSSQKAPTIRDVITIVEPNLDRVQTGRAASQTISEINMIKLREFKDFYINGRRVDISQVAKPQVKVSIMPDSGNQH